MLPYRAIIVDEDAASQDQLAAWLGHRDEVAIIGKYQRGDEAIHSINKERPDLVFMETEMPDMNGFKILENINTEHSPQIIFVSSNKDFAFKAFEVGALDFLQKPLMDQRLEKCIDRINKRFRNGLRINTTNRLVGDERQNPKLKRFIIKHSGEYHLIRTREILWFESDGNYSRIITKDKKFMVRHTLSGFEEQLDERYFYRISRSRIVNLDFVVKIKDHVYGNYMVELDNGVSLKMSKNYKDLLEVLKNF